MFNIVALTCIPMLDHIGLFVQFAGCGPKRKSFDPNGQQGPTSKSANGTLLTGIDVKMATKNNINIIPYRINVTHFVTNIM